MRTIPSLLLLLLASLGCASTEVRSDLASTDISGPSVAIEVLPRPWQLDALPGRFVLDASYLLVVDRWDDLEEAASDVLWDALDPEEGHFPGQESSAQDRPLVHIGLGADEDLLGLEGYQLHVATDGVELTAVTSTGLFYGLQTLRQLVQEPDEPGGENWLPCVAITDRPRFAWRGQLLDVSRHFQPFGVVGRNLQRLGELKMNVFHWHLTDDQGWRIESERYPELTSVGAWRVDRNDEPWWGRAEAQSGEEATYGGYYKKSAIRYLVEFARQRGITIVPEVDVPGHSRAIIAAYPELSCDGVQ
ncbi:MAG: family 20 glycosylhydrolase, partial [Proteobacteria bacterium]|nr:family 20 glycosylhydrolase [Pseudomonadota bacterium]